MTLGAHGLLAGNTTREFVDELPTMFLVNSRENLRRVVTLRGSL